MLPRPVAGAVAAATNAAEDVTRRRDGTNPRTHIDTQP
jgi:hypothetical protein